MQENRREGVRGAPPWRLGQLSEVSPWRTAYFVNSAMLKRSSFFMMLWRWFSTVFTLTPKMKAISFAFLPSAISCRISLSRWERFS